jgi:MoaA/NifB/PqqE/SkfB family radical SAM enzyme
MFSDSNQARDWLNLQHARDLSDQEPQCYNYPDAFFPEKGGNFQFQELKWAKDTCAVCPIREACAEYGIKWERFGIWGGIGAAERRDIRREKNLPEPLEEEAA